MTDRNVSLSTSLIPSGDPIPDSVADRRKRNYKLMPKPLRAISDSWKSRIHEVENLRLQTAFQMSLEIQEIESKPDVYGNDAPERLMAVHGLTVAQYRNLRGLSMHLSPEAFARIVEHNEDQKQKWDGFEGISLTHLFHLGTVNDGKLRIRMIERIAAEGLSEKQTYDELRAYRNQNPSSSNTSVVGTKPTAAVTRFHKSTMKCSGSAEVLLDDEFLQRVTSVAEKDQPKFIERLKQARDQIGQARVIFGLVEDRLTEALSIMNGGESHGDQNEDSEGVVDAVSVAAAERKPGKPAEKKERDPKEANSDSKKKPNAESSSPPARKASGGQDDREGGKRRVRKKVKRKKSPESGPSPNPQVKKKKRKVRKKPSGSGDHEPSSGHE